MSDLSRQECHRGGIVGVGYNADDPSHLLVSFSGTALYELFETVEVDDAILRTAAGYEVECELEDPDTALPEDALYVIYRENDPVAKARGGVLFAGPVTVVERDRILVFRSAGEPEQTPRD